MHFKQIDMEYINSDEFLTCSGFIIGAHEKLMLDGNDEPYDIIINGVMFSFSFLVLSHIVPTQMKFTIPLISILRSARKMYNIYKSTGNNTRSTQD